MIYSLKPEQYSDGCGSHARLQETEVLVFAIQELSTEILVKLKGCPLGIHHSFFTVASALWVSVIFKR
jgi:hypothetical protein